MANTEELTQYLEFAKQLALQAGEIMLTHFQIGVPTESKADNTPVTVADTAINQLVIDEIRERFPEHAVLGEEQSNNVASAKYVWVCDPLDGTPMYAAGLPVNVFGLALVDKADGQPIVAVVYDPYMKRLYAAAKDLGATVNNTPIHVGTIESLFEGTVSIISDRSKVADVLRVKAAIIEKAHRTRAMGSVLYEAMVVATGHFAGQVFTGSGAHDVAAAKLIVEEAGGKVSSIYGKEQRYDMKVRGAIISNGLVHKELVKLVAPHLLYQLR